MGENEHDTQWSTQKSQQHGWTGLLSDQEQRMKCNTNHLPANQGNWSETFDTAIKMEKETNCILVNFMEQNDSLANGAGEVLQGIPSKETQKDKTFKGTHTLTHTHYYYLCGLNNKVNQS